MTAVVDAVASLLLLLGVEYAGNVGRNGAAVLISFGGSLAALVLAGIRAATCQSSGIQQLLTAAQQQHTTSYM